MRIFHKIILSCLTWKGQLDVMCMLRNAANAREVNDRLLLRILHENRNSEYGLAFKFSDIHSVDEFKRRVPICTYNDIAPYIDRMYENDEKNLITSNKIIGYATSSGSVGKPKHIPRTNADVRIYTKYTVTRFLALAKTYLRKQGTRRVRNARGICLLSRYDDVSPFGLTSSNVADIAAKKYFYIYPQILVLPLGRQFKADEIDMKYACARFGLEEKDCSYIFYVFSKGIAELIEYIRGHWQSIADDIEHGVTDSSVFIRNDIRAELHRKLRPNPRRAAEIRHECSLGFDSTILARLWPNMSVISSIGTSATFERFTESIKKYASGIPIDYSIYGASEGLFAAAHDLNEPGQLLLADSCFYEFVDPDDAKAEQTLALDELEVGKEYEIIITNRSGFYRYRFHDVVRILGYRDKCPIVNFVYRKGQLLNITGEKTNMEQMTAALAQLEACSGAKIGEWTVFVDMGDCQHRYALLAETEDNMDLSSYAEQFDKILCAVNPQYLFHKNNQHIDPPVIMNQIPGTHDTWREQRVKAGASVDQVKPVRILDTDEKLEFFLSRVVPAELSPGSDNGFRSFCKLK